MMCEDEKTPEQLRLELYKKMREQQETNGEHLCEVAMPGVYRPVAESDINP